MAEDRPDDFLSQGEKGAIDNCAVVGETVLQGDWQGGCIEDQKGHPKKRTHPKPSQKSDEGEDGERCKASESRDSRRRGPQPSAHVQGGSHPPGESSPLHFRQAINRWPGLCTHPHKGGTEGVWEVSPAFLRAIKNSLGGNNGTSCFRRQSSGMLYLSPLGANSASRPTSI